MSDHRRVTMRVPVEDGELQITGADILEAFARLDDRPTPAAARPYLVHPADKKHIDDHGGGQAGCFTCLAIWQRASSNRG